MLIVLSIDGLSATTLGCYGNDWVGTPAIDALAAESVLFDFALTDTPSLKALRSFWSGRSAVDRHLADERAATSSSEADGGYSALPVTLKSRRWASLLFTDDRSILQFPEAAAFDEQVSMNAPAVPQTAGEAGATHLAAFFANAAETIDSFNGETDAENACMWLHAGSLATCWDAPLEYRHRYQEEGDPSPMELAAPPHQRIARDQSIDPDDLLGLRRAYAGQVALLDEMLETFLSFLHSTGKLTNAHFLLLAPRGFGLGEHHLIGYPGGEFELHEEYLHVPFLWRFPDELGGDDRHAAEHVQALVQPADLTATVVDILKMASGQGNSWPYDAVSLARAIRGEASGCRQLAMAISPDRQQRDYAIRSAAWHLVQRQCNTSEEPLLFAKPDDIREKNNVAELCPQVVRTLQDLARQIISGGVVASRQALDEALTEPH